MPYIKENHCRVCGYDHGYSPWGDDGCPDYCICDCCGAEAGNNDIEIGTIRGYREEWAKGGFTWGYRPRTKLYEWFDPKLKPDNWSFKEQCKNIPKEFQ